MTARLGVYRQIAATATGLYVGYGAFFVFGIVTNRTAGTAALGAFTVAYTSAQLVLQTLGGGLNAIHRREVAVAPERIGPLTAAHLARRLQILGGIAAAAVLLAATGVVAGGALLAAVFLAKAADGWAEIFEGALQAIGRSVSAAVVQAGRLLLGFGVAGATLVAGASLDAAACAYAATTATAVLALASWFHLRVAPLARREPVGLVALLRESWPLVLASAVATAGARLTPLAVGTLAGREVLGAYVAVLSLVVGVGMVGSATGTVLYPRFCAAWAGAPHRLRDEARATFVRLLGVAVPVALALAVLNPLLLRVYGRLPAHAGPAAATAALAIVPMLLQPAYGYALTAMGRQREVLVCSAVGLVLSLLGYGLLVPAAGLQGAAVALVLSQTLLAALPIAWVEWRHFRAGGGRLATAAPRSVDG